MTIAWTPGITAENWPTVTPRKSLPRDSMRETRLRKWAAPLVCGDTFSLAIKTQSDLVELVFVRGRG